MFNYSTVTSRSSSIPKSEKTDALDYLLKPIEYTDFLKAANKAKNRIEERLAKEAHLKADEQYLFVKADYKIVKIKLADIKYIEGMREYVRIHLEESKPVMTLISMNKLTEHLPADQFMRVHRSYIVNLNKVTTIERNRIVFDKDVYIPVSEQYREDFKTYVEKYFL